MPLPSRVWRVVFDVEARRWSRRVDDSSYREFRDATVKLASEVVMAPGPIADLGCGPGNYAVELARRGYDVAGVDSSRSMVAAANRQHAAAGLGSFAAEHGDLGSPLRFRDGEFAGVLCIAVIQFLARPAPLVREIARVLQPGGYLLLSAPSPDRYRVPGHLYWRARVMVSRLPGVIIAYTVPQLAELAKTAGLTVEDEFSSAGSAILARR
jgi:SAM-dependent methyltransferase